MTVWNVLTLLFVVVCLLNLALTLALVKRMREHDLQLKQGRAIPEPIADVGTRPDDFTATTIDGEQITLDDLIPGTLVGFFDPHCDTCHEHVVPFAKQAGLQPEGAKQVLAVIRDLEGDEEMLGVLRPVARVVIERRRGLVGRAFHVEAMPSFCWLGEGQLVVAHGYDRPGVAVAP